MSEQIKPIDIIVKQKEHQLVISYDDGVTYEYPAEFLRVYSPSAEVRGHFGKGAKLQLDKQDVNIEDVRLVGHYALKIIYDDGHDSGLYDWPYLYDLGKRHAQYWTQYLQKLHEVGHTYTPASWK